MARNPAATWRGPVPNVGGSMSSYDLFVVHIQDGSEAGTDAWFHNPAAQVSAHFGNPKTGDLDQWVDTDQVAWAEAADNAKSISVESEGFSGQTLTDSQLENVAQLFVWANKTHGIPLQITTDPNGRGMIGHGQLGAAGGGHYDCPGTPILNQFPAIMARAKQIAGGDMPLTQAEIDSVSNETSSLIRNTGLGEIDLAGNQTGTKRTLGNVIAQRNAMDHAILDAIAKVPGATIDYDQLGASVAKHIDYAQLSAALAAHFQVK